LQNTYKFRVVQKSQNSHNNEGKARIISKGNNYSGRWWGNYFDVTQNSTNWSAYLYKCV